MTPDESVAEIAKLVDAAQNITGGGWKLFGGSLTPTEDGIPGTLECRLPDGTTGTNYGLYWDGPAVADPDKTIAEIDAAWQKLGVKGTITNIGDGNEKAGDARILADPPYLSGTYLDGYAVQIQIGTKYSALRAQTHCIPIPLELASPDSASNSSDISDRSDISYDVRDYDW